MINNSIKKLDGFINDIIEYSRNQRLELKIQQVDIEQEVCDVFDDLRYLDKEGKIEKRVEVQEKKDFMTDARRVNVILKNLVSNSIRYYDQEKESPFIEVEVRFNSRLAVLKVSDNGIGIGEHHLDNIFNMFYRADEGSKGSGLGLYIVKETVDKLGGKIEVESKSGLGTSFTITLPSLSPN
jgi:signal transduction histidine kinase